ncbi:hypothetical protein ABZY81_00935 [Streptomyces sp. NPDC006514]|uniref:hypothetical protein n=1 Tax=Streptomyces sp. NPDC006514 TaxID=3154308 RepID=UPI0033B9633F
MAPLLSATCHGAAASGAQARVDAAAAGRGRGTGATLRTVLGHTGADIVESACVRVPVDRGTVGADGVITDEGVREQLAAVLVRLLTPR